MRRPPRKPLVLTETDNAGHKTRVWDCWIDQYLHSLKARRCSPSHIDSARYRLAHFIRYCATNSLQADTLQRSHCIAFLASLQDSTLAQWTIRGIAVQTRQFLRWLAEEGACADDLLRSRDLPRPAIPDPQPLTVEQVRAILTALDGPSWIDRRDYAIVLVLLETGCRRGELLQLTASVVDTGRAMVTAKGGGTLTLHLSSSTRRAIRQYLRALREQTGLRPDAQGALWLSAKRSSLTREGVLKLFRRLQPVVGERVWCHRFRSTCISWRLGDGADSELVRELVGHRSHDVIRHYLKYAESDKRKLLEDTSPLKRLR